MFFIALATAPTLTARLGSTRMIDAEGGFTSEFFLPEHELPCSEGGFS
jgi:hypothetical protein